MQHGAHVELAYSVHTPLIVACEFGNPEMVDACFGVLKDAGLPVPAIRREKYVSPPDPKGRSAGLAVVSE